MIDGDNMQSSNATCQKTKKKQKQKQIRNNNWYSNLINIK